MRKLTDQLGITRRMADQVQLTGLAKGGDVADELRGKLGQTQGALARIGNAAREAGAAFIAMGRMAVGGLEEAAQAAARLPGKFRAFGEAGSSLINKGFGAAAEGFAVYEPVREYAERDKLLRSIGIMEHLSGAPLEAEIRRLNQLVDRDALKNGLSSESVAEAYKDLLGQGLPRAMIDSIIGAHSSAAKAYGIPPDILGPVTGALVGNLKIAPNERDAGAALAALASASQGGRFKTEDFSHTLPGLTGVAASLGMTGRNSLNTLAAGLEISAKTATDPTQAGVNFEGLLSYITSNREDNLSRKKLGIDLAALLLKGERDGTAPLDTYLTEIKKLTSGKSPVAQAQVISSIVTNVEARKALLALVQHNDEFEALRKSLAGITSEKLKLDEASASAGAQTPLDQLRENVKQIMITLGQRFSPILGLVNIGLGWLNEKLTWLNASFPTTTSWMLGNIAALLALGAAITLIGAVVPVFATGFGLMTGVMAVALGPLRGLWGGFRYLLFVIEYFTGVSAGAVGGIVALAAAFALAAYDIYEHWSRFASFFRQMWFGVMLVFRGFLEFVAGLFTADLRRAFGGLETIGRGVAAVFGAMWAVVKQLFLDFGAWVEGWAPGIGHRIGEAIVGPLREQLGEIANLPHAFDNSWAGRHLGLADQVTKKAGSRPANDNATRAASAARPPTQNVHLTVQAEPGTRVTAAASDSPATSIQAPVQAPNRGATLARP